MSKTSKRRVRGIAIFIVFLALAATIVQFEKRGSKIPTFNFKDSQNEYRDLKFINKAKITFTSTDVNKAQSGINTIIDQLAKQKIRRQNEGGFGAYLFTLDQNEVNSVVTELKKYGSVVSQIEQVDTSLVNLDFESESTRLASYEKEQTDLALVRFPSDAQNRRKEALHAMIQQSRSNLERLEEAKNVLLYITLSPVRGRATFISQVESMVLTYLTWLGIFTIGAVLVYFGARLIMHILSLMGVKGFSSGGLGGGYNYGGSYSKYDRYGANYGYRSNKRKVKRIYKDKSNSSDSEEENK